MTLLEEIDVDAERETSAPRLRPWFVAGLVLLCGLLILAHGCHGNDDNELFNISGRAAHEVSGLRATAYFVPGSAKVVP